MSEMRIFVAPEKGKFGGVSPVECSVLTSVESLFQALSTCSALHASLLPSGEPSSFFGMDDDDDEEDGAFDDADDQPVAAGRVRSDFHSGGGPEARFQPY